MIKICKNCGQEFKSYHYNRENPYCSKKCFGEAHRKLNVIKYKCDYCGNEFERKEDSYFKKSKKHFCCIDCANNYQKRNKAKFICKTCGKEFYRSPSWTKQKSGFYCSIECRNKSEEWYKNAICVGNQIQNKNRGANKLEKSGNSILDELNLNYKTQYLINDKICVDAYLPEFNIVIQWDGSYWHGRNKKYEELEERIKKRVNLDKSQDNYMATCGYKVLRFWDEDVYKRREYVYDTIKEAIQQFTK